MVQILVFGDSITYGAWDLEGGWVQRLRKYLDKINLTTNSYYLIYNLGVSGDTTDDVLYRFKFESEQRLCKEEETIIIFAIGTNDCGYLKSKKSLKISKNKFKVNIKSLINCAKAISDKIIFLGLTPVDETKTNLLAWNKDVYCKNNYIKAYDQILKEMCKPPLHFIEVYNNLGDYRGLLEDGDHPNSKGHDEIFKIVKDYLVKNKLL